MLTRTNCNNNVHSLKFSMVDSSLILNFSLQEVARSCSGLERRCTHCWMEIVGTGAGATHMRAVQAGAGCGRWQGLHLQRARLSALASQNHAGQRELSRLRARARASATARLMCARPGRGAGASTCPGCRLQSALLNK